MPAAAAIPTATPASDPHHPPGATRAWAAAPFSATPAPLAATPSLHETREGASEPPPRLHALDKPVTEVSHHISVTEVSVPPSCCLHALDKPERFVLAVGGLPHVRPRLRLWQLRHNCAERVAAVKSACGLLLAAFAQVLVSSDVDVHVSSCV